MFISTHEPETVEQPDTVVRQLFSLLSPGGVLRYFEHIASSGWRSPLQRLADATVWPRLAGNCHTNRHTEQTIVDAGFQIEKARRDWQLPRWVPMPSMEVAIGRAVRPYR